MERRNLTSTWNYFSSNDALLQYYVNNSEQIWAGVVFSADPFPGSSFVSNEVGNFYYTIRAFFQKKKIIFPGMNASYLPPVQPRQCDLSNIGNLLGSLCASHFLGN